jgi:hypothetical protein
VTAEMSTTDWITAVSTGIIALLTIILAWVAYRQRAETKIVQRAYLNVKPEGIVTNTQGELLGHVAFKNVGKLPATEFKYVFMDVMVSHGDWKTPRLKDRAFENTDDDQGLVPVGASVPIGSSPITLAQVARSEVPDDKKYLYVWGRAKFMDGFSSGRWINFCHRYPWAKREPAPDGLMVSKRHARYHNWGNSADG